jgi:hypothetical protein
VLRGSLSAPDAGWIVRHPGTNESKPIPAAPTPTCLRNALRFKLMPRGFRHHAPKDKLKWHPSRRGWVVAEPDTPWVAGAYEERPIPPHPCPFPKGEGELKPGLRCVGALRVHRSADNGAPSPRGEGKGEGERVAVQPTELRDYRDGQTPGVRWPSWKISFKVEPEGATPV